MSDWGWVTLAYVTVYGTLGAYLGWTALRWRKAAPATGRDAP